MHGTQFLGPRTQLGQAIVLIALMIVVLFGAVGLAIDGGIGYYYNTSAERAAAAAALSGVIFMPGQFTPGQAVPAASGNDATDRAIVEARRNGFDIGDATNSVTVTAARVPGFNNKLSVTVSRRAPVFFMQLFGINSFNVSRTAIATYLPPLSLGQPGTQTGSAVADLGSGTSYFFTRTEGWSVPRDQGDAFTPNPNSGVCPCPSADVHAISNAQGSDTNSPALPNRGGYNYLIDLPAGGYIEVYNAIFGPDNAPSLVGGGPASEGWAKVAPNGAPPAGTTRNTCNNHISATGAPVLDTCSVGGSYYYHEEDGQDFSSYGGSQKDRYSAMEYTVEQVNTPFIRASDVIISQVKVFPIDASGYWRMPAVTCVGGCTSTNNYTPINNTAVQINQQWDATGAPVNMQTYHSWVDITGANYNSAGDGGTFQQIVSPAPGPLPAGQYRLRVDTLGFDGTNPPTNGVSPGGQAHKGYAVRVVDSFGGSTCAGCSVGAWDDMAIYTPIAVVGGVTQNFKVPMFKIPPDYAGQTITMDIFDPGDISGGGNVDLTILDNTGTPVTVAGPAVINIWDLGTSRTNVGPNMPCGGGGGIQNPPAPCIVGTGQPQNAYIRATSGGSTRYNGHWLRFEIPVPPTYAPGANPNNWWWQLQYTILSATSTTATDTLTIAVGLKGNPAHLLIS